jgi:hypothetical protein
MPLLDRNRYLKDDGARMSDDELRGFLRGAYETLATEGLNKTEPGQFKGTGSRANRGSDSRQIHFADGDAWLAYMKDFGKRLDLRRDDGARRRHDPRHRAGRALRS